MKSLWLQWFSAVLVSLCLLVPLPQSSLAADGEDARETKEEATSAIFLSHRHIVILSSDIENIWGTYYFAVHNKTAAPLLFHTQVMMPKQAVDFRAQDGLTPADIRLGAGGELVLEKEFAPGLSLVGIGFQVKTLAWGDDHLTFVPPVDLDEFSLAAPRNSLLQLQADAFSTGIPPMLAGGDYEGIISQSFVPKGQVVQVRIQGIPKARGRLWMMGFGAAIALVMLAGFFTMKTRSPGHGQGAEELGLS